MTAVRNDQAAVAALFAQGRDIEEIARVLKLKRGRVRELLEAERDRLKRMVAAAKRREGC